MARICWGNSAVSRCALRLLVAARTMIAGAQIGQAMVRLTNDSILFGLGRPQVLIETEAGALVSKLLFREYLLTMLLHRNANLARAMREFEQTAEQLRRLLE